jgi:dihydroorotate dehydrogenase electron transfer subunit
MNGNISKFDVRAKILSNQKIAASAVREAKETAKSQLEAERGEYFRMKLASPEIAANAKPGQFIHLLIDHRHDPLLRRPFTIYRAKNNGIEILFQVIGRGTYLLSQKQPGDEVEIMGPLGNTFLIPDELETAILVGGGIGIASLMMLAETLERKGKRVIGLIGAQNCERILCVDEFQALGVEVYVSTDDGSCGHHGLVTDLLQQILSSSQEYRLHDAYGKQQVRGQRDKEAKEQRDKGNELDDKNALRFTFNSCRIYACGSDGMLKSTAEIAAKFHLPAQLALENRMACGVGACLGCVLQLKSADDKFEYKRVCVEGPIFDAQKIVWNSG